MEAADHTPEGEGEEDKAEGQIGDEEEKGGEAIEEQPKKAEKKQETNDFFSGMSEPVKTSVKVRNPPGGKSSITF
jgi:hypothetical protein